MVGTVFGLAHGYDIALGGWVYETGFCNVVPEMS
jgi:hypothetical protein